MKIMYHSTESSFIATDKYIKQFSCHCGRFFLKKKKKNNYLEKVAVGGGGEESSS